MRGDVRAVLDTLQPLERIAMTRGGEWYAIQIMPYRTLEDVVEGAVLTFVSVDELKKMEQVLRRSEHYWKAGLKTLSVTLSVQDSDLRYLWVYSSEDSWLDQQAVGLTDFDLLSKKQAETLSALKQRVLQTGTQLCQEFGLTRGGKTYWGELRVAALHPGGSQSTELATSFTRIETPPGVNSMDDAADG